MTTVSRSEQINRAGVEGSVSTRVIPCVICGGTQVRRLYTKFGHDIARCRGCDLVYATPRAEGDAIRARYSHDYFWNEYLPALGVVNSRYDLTRFDARYAPLLQLLGTGAGRRLLEIGCGAGFFLKAAERSGWIVEGVEFSEEAARFAREELRLSVRQQPAEAMRVESATFDAVVMFDTIEHLFDPRAVLEASARSLVSGGLALISTPNFRALSRRLLGQEWGVLNPIEHLYYFEEATLAPLLEVCGFSDIRFVRQHAAWTCQETMNWCCSHAPRSWRATLGSAVGRCGGLTLARLVQHFGRQDILLCQALRTTAV